jgi:hypothetical protein
MGGSGERVRATPTAQNRDPFGKLRAGYGAPGFGEGIRCGAPAHAVLLRARAFLPILRTGQGWRVPFFLVKNGDKARSPVNTLSKNALVVGDDLTSLRDVLFDGLDLVGPVASGFVRVGNAGGVLALGLGQMVEEDFEVLLGSGAGHRKSVSPRESEGDAEGDAD